MKSLRASWFMSLCLTLIALLPQPQAHAEKVATLSAPTGYVDDYAAVLSTLAKEHLEGLCKEVHDKTKAQVFFVTVKTLDGQAVETFANELFAKWKIGEKKTDRGVLLLLAIQDHKRWIEVGYGFEGILNDAKAGDIGREMVPSLQAANYDQAARIGVQDVSKLIAADAGVTLTALDDTQAPSSTETQAATGPKDRVKPGRLILAIAPFLFFFCVFGLIVWRSIKRGVRFGGGGGSVGSGDTGSSSGSSFGGDSGGSSDSFSGGDGGSSGGGGAGGSW